MKNRMPEALAHGLVAFLYAAGLCMTLLCVLSLTAHIPLALGIILVVTALCTAASLNKWSSLLSGLLVLIGAGAWTTAMGGLTVLTDVLRAVTLHMTGLTAALPLVATETAVLLALLCGLAAFMLTWKGAGGYPALMVMLLTVLLLWLGNKPLAMVYMLPAVIATVSLMVHLSHVILPLRRILPLAAVVTVLAYAIVPESGVTIGPMKDAADELRQKIFDYLFFTEPRNVFSLASEGFYPQGQSQLGGPATPDDTPVMMVSTPKRNYLRGAVKDEYTGRTWLDTKSGRRYLWVSPQWRTERLNAFDMLLPEGALGADEGLMQVEQISVRMVDVSASSMFVPQRIRDLQPGGDLVPYFNASSEVFATRDLQPGDTYTVSAPLMLAGEAGLGIIINAAAGNDPAYAGILQDYTKLPDHLQQELFDLAQRITADAATPYDKAYALQTHLSRSYRYALDVELQPGNIDFVSNFLLNTKEGYCTYFASAMTVLCRMVGLPARYVEGYLAEPDANGVAYVTGMDAHAWTEVYFEGFGWLTFDATPAQGNGSSSDDQQDDQQQDTESELPTPPPADPPAADEEPTPTPSSLPDSKDTPQPTVDPDTLPPETTKAPNLWWLLLLLLAAVAATVRIILTQPKRLASRQKTELDRWMVWTQALHDALRILKLDRQPNESPLAHMRRLDGLHRWRTELAPLGVCESLVFYGRLDPQPDETMQAADAYGRIVLGLKWYQKVLLTLTRAFVPLKKRDFTK